MLMHASANIEAVRPLSNDERRASWAFRYFLHGFHRNPGKPRIRVSVTVPQPLREPSRAAPAPVGALPLPGAAPGGRQAASLPVHKGDLPDMTPE